MSGDPTNANLWADADVYVAPTDAEIPAALETEFGPDWELVGLLNGDNGFGQSRNEDTGDHYGWGGILIRTSRRNFKLTIGFTALEYNDVTRELIWPDSPPGKIVVPRPKRIRIAFETREGPKVHRLISALDAEVAVNGDIVNNETALTNYPFLATIFPDASEDPAVLLIEQGGEVGGS